MGIIVVNKIDVIKNNFYMLKLAWSISKSRVLLDFFMSALAMYKKYFIGLIYIQVIVDFINVYNFSFLIKFIFLSSLFFLLTDLLETWYRNRFIESSNCLFYEKVNEILFEKVSNVDMECFENSEFYDMYLLASKEADSRIISIISDISGVFFSFALTVAIYITMFSIDRFVICLVVFPLISLFIILKKIKDIDYVIAKEKISSERAIAYTERVARLRDYAEEIRLYNINNVILKILREQTHHIVYVYKKYRVGQVIRSILQKQFAFTFLYEGTLLYCAFKVLCFKSMTIGEFVILASAMKTGVWTLYELTSQISRIYENGLFIENFVKFIHYHPTIAENQGGKPVDKNFREIEVRNIGFRYQGEKNIYSNLSLRIKKGEILAIVGCNGVGKTTITKLLTRLYDPIEGEILYNGVNIKEYNLQEYRSLFSVLNQDFKIFALSIKDNIFMGQKVNEHLLNKVLEAAGIEDEMTIDKLNTTITREFDDKGAFFSGGEYQKIAIARAFAKDFEIAIFDEPSSALDPVSEYNLFQDILKIGQGKTLIFITHRLTSTMFADRIAVIQDGVIKETGSHQELYVQKGIYYEMFRSQAERYISEKKIYHENE